MKNSVRTENYDHEKTLQAQPYHQILSYQIMQYQRAALKITLSYLS